MGSQPALGDEAGIHSRVLSGDGSDIGEAGEERMSERVGVKFMQGQ